METNNTHTISVESNDDELQHVPIFSQLAVLAVVLMLILGAGITPRLLALITPEATSSAVMRTLPTFASEGIGAAAFTDVAVSAQAAFVWDVTKQQALYEKNPDEQLPLASITKLMTALIANELLTSTSTIDITETAINQDGASGLLSGEQFTLRNISDLMLLTSSNDGAYAVAETLGKSFDQEAPAEAFVALMNIRAKELGLSQTYFRNVTGLDITKTEAGAYGSARDVALLMEYILNTDPAIIEATADPAHTIISRNGISHSARNTNQTVSSMTGMIGSKTGYTELAGGNLVVAFDAGINHPVVVVVLGSTWQGRFDDVQTLLSATRNAL